MAFSEGTMNRMNAALRALRIAAKSGTRAMTALAESEAQSKRFPEDEDQFRIENTCCGKCPVGTTCYVDTITGA